MGADFVDAVNNSNVPDDLPQLPALLTSVSNSIAGSVLPPSLGRGGASLCEGGALPCGRGQIPRGDLFFPSSEVHFLYFFTS